MQTVKIQKPVISHSVAIVMLSAVLVIIFAFTIWNASVLRTALNQSTEMYAQDVLNQQADGFSSRMQSIQRQMNLMADSISVVRGVQSDEDLSSFLGRKSKISGFDELAFIDENGKVVPSDFSIPTGEAMSVLQPSFEGERLVLPLEGQKILYSVPVWNDGRVSGVLAGTRDKKNMQTLLQSDSFQGQGLMCIVDHKGEVIVAPTDIDPFLRLEDIFKEGGDSEEFHSVQEMKGNLENQEGGVIRFTAVNGEKLVLSYNSLGVNDWMLLSLIPENLISSKATGYITWTFVAIGITILVFACFLFFIFHFYQGNKRHLERVAYMDAVTGGMNNSAFQAQYFKEIHSGKPVSFSVVLLNIKGFKLINEKFGASFGDETLKSVYQNIKSCLKSGEFCARGDADNFFLCLKEHEPDSVQSRLNVIMEKINSRVQSEDFLEFYQGAYIVDDPDTDIMLIEDRARTAYQSSKSDDSAKCTFYDASFTKKLQMERELNAMFYSALEKKEFQLYLQPKVRIKTGRIEGAEALVRWLHTDRGIISPSQFIPIFERSGKICRLDAYMFEEVCTLIEKWKNSGTEPVPISVNLSRRHFDEPDFLLRFADTARKYHVPRNMIEFELTESIFFDNTKIKIVKESIKQMHKLGFLCSLDDFGSGFSSLGLIKEFDVDAIKMDKQFFTDVSDQKSQDIIKCLIELAEKLHMRTVAEGIETEEQLRYMRQFECDLVQGYVYAKPMPVGEFEEWVKKNRGAD